MTGKRAGLSKSNEVSAKYWMEKLRLEPHPEGGYFRQTYKSELMIAGQTSRDSHPPADNAGRMGQPANCATRVGQPAQSVGQPETRVRRAASTAIYFLLEGENFSAFHRLRSDEMWHFYAGSALIVHVIDPGGKYSSILLGDDPERDEVFQGVVKAKCWFASEVRDRKSWALVGCTVAPGFEFEDFELGKREELVREFSKHRELIERLTRG